jgi:hypothetical protein
MVPRQRKHGVFGARVDEVTGANEADQSLVPQDGEVVDSLGVRLGADVTHTGIGRENDERPTHHVADARL